MKLGIYLTARLGSSRLPRKHLLPTRDRPVFQALLTRIFYEFSREIQQDQADVVITTSDNPENKDFERFGSFGAKIFYGSTENIPYRHLQAMRHFGHQGAVSVDGDDILCSPAAMRAVWAGLTEGFDLVKTAGLPFGMNASGYLRSMLERSVAGHEEDTLETGWGRIFQPANAVTRTFPELSKNELLRFSLDYKEDLEFFVAAISALGERLPSASDAEIVGLVEQLSLDRLNRAVAVEYWKNFHRQLEKEKQRNA